MFLLLTIGTLRSNDADNNEKVKKTIGLISTTTTSHEHHAFLYISFPFLHDYDVKMPNFAFYGGRKQAKTKFYFSFWAWIWSLEIQLGGFAYNWQSKWAGIIGIKTEKTQIHFLRDVLVAVASLDLKVPSLISRGTRQTSPPAPLRIEYSFSVALTFYRNMLMQATTSEQFAISDLQKIEDNRVRWNFRDAF